MTDHPLLNQAHKVCTPNELEALELSNRGMSQRSIAIHLNLSRTTVKDRIANARRKIDQARKEAAA